jgi:hypothetical protein
MNGFSVGRDVSIDIFGNLGNIERFNLITMFEAKQNTTRITIKGMDGVNRYLELPEGWEGSFAITRGNRAVDDYFAQIENTYYDGGDITAAAITETISEPGGGISQWRYEGVMMKLDDAGSFQGDAEVKQKISFCASRKRKVV